MSRFFTWCALIVGLIILISIAMSRASSGLFFIPGIRFWNDPLEQWIGVGVAIILLNQARGLWPSSRKPESKK